MLRLSCALIISLLVLSGHFGTDFSTVRFDGVGPVRVGMDLSELNKVLRTSYSKPSDTDQQGCFYIEVPGQTGILLMLLDGHVARVDVDNASTRTTAGVHNGDSEARAQELYGKQLQTEPHKYVETGHYLTVLSADGKYGVRFETDKGSITRYYAGTKAAISLVEGCG